MKLSLAIECFRTQLEANAHSCHTIGSYLHDLGLLAAALGPESELEAITTDALARFLTGAPVTRKPDGSPKAPGSVDKVKTSVKAFFRWAHEAGLAEGNPAAAIRLKHRRRPSPDVLTTQEKRSLVKAIDQTRGPKAERDATLFDLILNTGLRVSEVLGLDMSDVNVAEKQVTVAAKGGETHKVFLNARTRARLAAYLKKRKLVLGESQALFLSNRRERLSVRQAEVLVEDWLRRAGIGKHVTVHGLRHTFATHLLERTGNLRTVQEALRHRNIATTVRYTHQPSEAVAEALEAL